MDIEVFISFFVLIGISVLTYSFSRRFSVPYSVLLVLTGSLLVPLSRVPAFSFIKGFELSPEMLFFVFLPILIFESAYNMNVRDFVANIRAISWFSVASLLISAGVISTMMFLGFRLIGFDIPFIVAVLFGALISATDPVAVLALFKEYGAPRRLSFLFEGESLFNDGTSFALFMVVLDILIRGFDGIDSVADGLILFVVMIVGGALIGLLLGVGFSKILGKITDQEHVEITLTMLAAHATFLLTEFLSENVSVFGYELRFSSIIATVIASMVIGNYGRSKISPRVEERLEEFWGYFAFVANSLVFILMGLLFAGLPIRLGQFIMPILLVIGIVMVARAVSVYPVAALLNVFGKEEKIPLSWQHLLSWGSLRGALAVIMVLLIPNSVTTTDWNYPFSVKEFIMALTIGCIYFTLFIKATTMSTMMRRLGIGKLHALEETQYHQARSLIHAKAMSELDRFREEGYIDETSYNRLRSEHDAEYVEAERHCRTFFSEGNRGLAEQALRVYALGIERRNLRILFRYDEISEFVYKRILAKIDVQRIRVERNERQVESLDETFDLDPLERLISLFRSWLTGREDSGSVKERFMYYRAQSIIAGKVLKQVEGFKVNSGFDAFGDREVFDRVIGCYHGFQEDCERNLAVIRDEHPASILELGEELGRKGLFKAEESILHDLSEHGMITPKLAITLYDELRKEEYRR